MSEAEYRIANPPLEQTRPSNTCWSCGVDQEPQRPRRADFESEPDYLIACLVWLDFAYPQRVQYRDRAAEYARLERESDPRWVRRRLGELLAMDDPTDDHDAEFARLADLYKTHNRKGYRS